MRIICEIWFSFFQDTWKYFVLKFAVKTVDVERHFNVHGEVSFFFFFFFDCWCFWLYYTAVIVFVVVVVVENRKIYRLYVDCYINLQTCHASLASYPVQFSKSRIFWLFLNWKKKWNFCIILFASFCSHPSFCILLFASFFLHLFL